MHTSLLTDQFIFHLSAYKRFTNAYVAAPWCFIRSRLQTAHAILLDRLHSGWRRGILYSWLTSFMTLTAVQLSVTRSEHLHVKLSRLHATKHDGALRPPGVHLFPIASTHSLLDVRTNIPFINTHSHAQPFLRFSPFRRYFPPQYPICSTLAMRSRGTTGRSGCL